MHKVPKGKVVITVTYGSPRESIILNAVMVAASELLKKGIEPEILQIYSPGATSHITVNGKQVKIDEKLHKTIQEVAYESLIEESAEELLMLISSGVAAAKIE